MKQHILCIFLALCMALCIVPAEAIAAEGTLPAGKGTENDPYIIFTAAELKAFRDIVNGENGQEQNTAACAKLMNDIVLNDGTFDEEGKYTPGENGKKCEYWDPIGNYNAKANTGCPYSGTFDGNGHTIKGLYVKNDNYNVSGLFGNISGGGVKNLTVTGYVAGWLYAGGIAGYIKNNAYISDCANFACVTALGNDNCFGGIVGNAGNSNISNCCNFGTINGNRRSGIGGIAGYTDNSTFINCYNVAAVSGSKSIGGIVGSNAKEIRNCYNVGEVSGNEWVGGILGYGYESKVVNCCWLEGTAVNAMGRSEKESEVVDTYESTKNEFENGKVLNRLQYGAAIWDKCGYFAAAKMILPLFGWQTEDPHDHIGGEWEKDETTHWKACSVCHESYNKEIHSGTDDGDCTTAVNCVCGYVIKAAQGEHVYPAAWTSNRPEANHSRKCRNCGISETEACRGGTATCKDKAICEDCNESYGELKPDNHSNLSHIDAKAATDETEGNTEYWYCSGCDRYFKDEALTKAITKADTVIEKQTDTVPEKSAEEKPVSPKTGDTSNVLLWIFMLLICGGTVAVITIAKRKKS